MMWQEARKQERKIRGLLVDFKKRAERRKDYYEKIKADPTQFLQLHGRPCKIHLDPAIAIAADSPANIMPWQGNQDILIDRFDVRAHLDYIPEIKSKEEEDLDYDERHINYERYRILVQNDFLGVSENKFLHQLAIEEQFGPVEKTGAPPIEGKKKVPGAAIGYNYNEGTVVSSPTADSNNSDQEDEEEDEEDSDVDFDLCVDINKIGSQQAHEMNACAHIYGMTSNDFFSFLTKDVEEAENLKIAREREEEKAMYSGRKSRRERRAYREKKLLGRKLSPPSYASKILTDKDLFIKSPSKSVSKSRSRSVSPVNAGQITYITSFGGEEQDPALQAPKPSIPQKEEFVYKRTVRYRSRTRSRSPKRRVTYRGRSRSRSRDRNKSSSQSRRTRSHSRSRRSRSRGQRSRSPCPKSRSRRSHSRSNNRRSPGNQSHYRRHHNSRSRTRSKSPYKMNINTAKKSKSPSPSLRSVEVPAPPVITRYYGRHRNNSSSSELELSDSEKESSEKNMSLSEKNNRSCLGNSISRNKVSKNHYVILTLLLLTCFLVKV
uniref:Suppressor of white apricot N-terminal domain-containing protein n=1 Tax=Clastoptera arizonana TaxID=38151 RepID=A0A1B6DU17_9HEMI